MTNCAKTQASCDLWGRCGWGGALLINITLKQSCFYDGWGLMGGGGGKWEQIRVNLPVILCPFCVLLNVRVVWPVPRSLWIGFYAVVPSCMPQPSGHQALFNK